MTELFSPLTVRTTTIRNRLWVSPMCQYSAEDGMPNTWHLTHLTQFASGGAGLVMAEATAVVPEGRISPGDVGLWNDAQRDAWAPITAVLRERGATPAIQLAHAGRKASTRSPLDDRRGSVPIADGGWQTVAPSAIGYPGMADPVALDDAGIDAVVDAFAAAAVRAVAAGFEVIEVHAAHGYLLHEFLSPLTNRRTDAYGGDLEGRARLLLRVVAAVRAAAPETAVLVRFSATDWAPGGLTVDDVVEVAPAAAAHGADGFDVSSGGLVAEQRIATGPGYQVAFAAAVRAGTGLPTVAVGEITSGAQAQTILATGQADATMAGREWLRDPHFGLRVAAELGVDDESLWPPQYRRARAQRHPAR